jgi:hypothetical protein
MIGVYENIFSELKHLKRNNIMYTDRTSLVRCWPKAFAIKSNLYAAATRLETSSLRSISIANFGSSTAFVFVDENGLVELYFHDPTTGGPSSIGSTSIGSTIAFIFIHSFALSKLGSMKSCYVVNDMKIKSYYHNVYEVKMLYGMEK